MKLAFLMLLLVACGGSSAATTDAGPHDGIDAGAQSELFEGMCPADRVGGGINNGCDCGCLVDDPDCGPGGMCDFDWCPDDRSPGSAIHRECLADPGALYVLVIFSNDHAGHRVRFSARGQTSCVDDTTTVAFDTQLMLGFQIRAAQPADATTLVGEGFDDFEVTLENRDSVPVEARVLVTPSVGNAPEGASILLAPGKRYAFGRFQSHVAGDAIVADGIEHADPTPLELCP